MVPVLTRRSASSDQAVVLARLVAKAERHLEAARRYIAGIPRHQHGIRLFCLWPLFLAVMTVTLVFPGAVRGPVLALAIGAILVYEWFVARTALETTGYASSAARGAGVGSYRIAADDFELDRATDITRITFYSVQVDPPIIIGGGGAKRTPRLAARES